MTAIHGYREVHTKSFLEKTKNALNVNQKLMTDFLKTVMDTDKSVRKAHDKAVKEAAWKRESFLGENKIASYFEKGDYTKLTPTEQYQGFSEILRGHANVKLYSRLFEFSMRHDRIDSVREFLHETGEEYAFIKVDDYKLVGSLIN